MSYLSIAYNKVIECDFEHVSEGPMTGSLLTNRSRLALGMVSANACFTFHTPF